MAKKRTTATVARKPRTPKNATLRDPIQDWLRDALVDKEADTGVKVNGRTVLGYAPVWSCVNKIAGHVGYLPVKFYERSAANPKDVREVTNTVPYYAIAVEPNAYMTAQTFKETLTSDAILHGNGRAYIVRDGNGQASEFIPLPPESVATFLVKFDERNQPMEGGAIEAVAYRGGWEKWHAITLKDGSKYYAPDANVLHIPGLGYDGLQGYSVVDLAKQSLGLGMAAERAALKHFSKGARPSFLLKAPPGVFTKAEDAKEFLHTFREQHEGMENEGKVGLLRNGIDVATLQQTARDSQQNEQRLFQRQEVALLFAVEQILGDDSSVSYRSLEEKNRAYITNCLNRWLTKWEQELYRKTLTVTQRRAMRYYYRFDDWELTRGTMFDRFQAYQLARQAEILSANECREMEDLEPREGGDDYANPAINPQTAKAEPATDPDKAAKKAIASRIEHIAGVETKRLVALAESPGRFIDAVEKFYAGWRKQMGTVVTELGADDGLAEEWVVASMGRMMEASSIAKPDNLKAIVQGEVAAWRPRVEKLIDSIQEVAFHAC